MYRFICLFFLTIILGGCRTAELATSEEDGAAKSFIAPVNQGNLYIIRDETFIGRAYTFEVLVDGKLVGVTGPRTYLLLTLPPGPHTITSIHTRFFSLSITIKPSQNYFVRQIPQVDWPEPSASLTQLNESAGQAAVNKCKRVPNQF